MPKHIPSRQELIFFSCKYNYNIKWVPRSSLRSSFPISSARVTWVVSWTILQHSHFQGLQNNNNSNNSYPEHCLILNWFFKWIPFYWSDEERVKRPPLQVLWPQSHLPGFQRGSQKHWWEVTLRHFINNSSMNKFYLIYKHFY